MEDKTGFVKHWGEIEEPLPKTRSLHLEITEAKAADYEEPKLHQPSAEHYPPKDELLDKYIASVKPPVDKHSQNLVLHSIELQHHKRRMRLMLMAAQHQQVEMMRSECHEFPPLPAPPTKPTKFCSSKGIVTPPTQATILARAQDQNGNSAQESHSSFPHVELDSISNRQLLYRAVAATCAFSGFELANESTLETLTDIADDFNTRLCKLLRSAVDNEALNGRSGFSDAMEYSLHEIGLGGITALQKYWLNNVQDYALRLEQEDKQMIQEYQKMTQDPSSRSSLVKQEEKDYFLIKQEPDAKHSSTFLKPFNNEKEITEQTDFPNFSPTGIATNGNGDLNSDNLQSPHWSLNYKGDGDDEYNEDPMISLVPQTPQ